MSKWYEVSSEEMDSDVEDEEVSFFVFKDNEGSVYLSLSFKQIEEIASKIEAIKTVNP